MFKRILTTSLIAATVAASGAALAQAPAKPAAVNPAKAGAKVEKAVATKVAKGKLLIDNHRDTVLTELSLQPAGAKAGTEPIVITKQLESGKKVTVALPAKSGCVFNISGAFEDESTLDVPEKDLCKDPVITLVE